MKRRMLTISLGFMIFSLYFVARALGTLTIDLHIGITSPEVKLLQQILNTDSDTLVALDGSGSKGFETEYFGARTQAAVIRFQEKHRAEILAPAGLSNGTGFVGPLTRVVLNKISSSTVVTAPAAPISPKVSVTPPSSPYTNPYGPVNYFATSSLDLLSPYLSAPFNPSQLSSTTKARYDAYQGASNAIFALLKAKFNIVVDTSTSTLAAAPSSTMPKIKDGAIAPKISMTSKPVNLSDSVIINGTGITKTNSVYTNLGHLDNVAVLGTSTLRFELSSLPGFSYYSNLQKSSLASTSVLIWVYNENGVSNILGPYNVNF